MRSFKEITIKEVQDALQTGGSWRSILRRLGAGEWSRNIEILKKLIEEYRLDASKISPGTHRTHGRRVSMEKYFRNEVTTHDPTFKHRLVVEGYKQAKCEVCHRTSWLTKPIPLQIHHIDGNHRNNALENLQFLCPNCHAQTENYAGRVRLV